VRDTVVPFLNFASLRTPRQSSVPHQAGILRKARDGQYSCCLQQAMWSAADAIRATTSPLFVG
jgi:hypothetical protein